MNESISYQLIRSERKTIGVQIKDGKVIVRAPMCMKNEDVHAFLQKHAAWIKKHLQRSAVRNAQYGDLQPLSEAELKTLVERARAIIPGRVRYYAELLGVTYGTVTVRRQRTRWGSCTAQGNLNFNCLLMLTPQEVLDSVIVHELCHRREMNHSARFYALVSSVYPDYPKWNAWLKANGDLLMRRLPR